MFWKDHLWYIDQVDVREDGYRCGFGSDTFGGYAWVSLGRSTVNPTMWVVTNIETLNTVEREGVLHDIRKDYRRPNIQVLHKRI
jgi:hypothetical protein